MGYEILGALFFGLATPLVLLGFVAFWATTHRARVAGEAVWRSYATTHGFRFIAAEGEWPNRTNPSVTWFEQGARFALSLVGREHPLRTRLRVTPREVILGEIVAIAGPG